MPRRYEIMRSNGSSRDTSVPGSFPFANWVTFDQFVEASDTHRSQPETKEPGAELSGLMVVLKSTMSRESDAADVIQRLAFRADGSSELGERARKHAAELRRLSSRLDGYLQRAGNSREGRLTEAVAASRTIATLDRSAAITILVRYLIQHAEATSEVLEGVGNGINAKAIQILCQKVAREKQKIAAWIEKQGHTAQRH